MCRIPMQNCNGKDADVESLKYDSATYADLVASQLQEERYAAWSHWIHLFWIHLSKRFFCEVGHGWDSPEVSESNRAIGTVLEGNTKSLAVPPIFWSLEKQLSSLSGGSGRQGT